MSKLNLRIDKHLDPDDVASAPPSVFANIFAIDPESGRRKRGEKSYRELVPISEAQHHTREIDLEPGTYAIEVALPTGEMLTDRVQVAAAQKANVVLRAEPSPHEWLGWQHLAGNVSNAAVQRPIPPPQGAESAASAPPAPPKPGAPGRATKGVGRRSSGARSTRGAAPVSSAAAPPAPARVPDEILWLTSPISALLPGVPGDPWQEVGAIAERPWQDIALTLNGHTPPRSVPKLRSDDRRAVFRVVHGNAGVSSAQPLDSPRPREFAAVPIGTSVELVSLPMPWLVFSSGRQAVVELVVQQPSQPRDFATSLTVRDDRLSIVLGFLTSGALTMVRDLADTAKEMLYYKMGNPLAAAAGGYALVGTASDTSNHEWHEWIDNLYNRFPYVPDGAIQVAQLHLRLRRNPADIDKARTCIKDAYRRGVPFYSLGIRWMLDVLEKLAPMDPECEDMRQAVQRVAWCAHPQSAFTILRLGV